MNSNNYQNLTLLRLLPWLLQLTKKYTTMYSLLLILLTRFANFQTLILIVISRWVCLRFPYSGINGLPRSKAKYQLLFHIDTPCSFCKSTWTHQLRLFTVTSFWNFMKHLLICISKYQIPNRFFVVVFNQSLERRHFLKGKKWFNHNTEKNVYLL